MFSRSILVALLVSTLGCAVSSPAQDDSEIESTSEDAVAKKLPAPAVASQRLYFVNPTKPLPYGGGAMAWPYPASGETTIRSPWVFDAKGGTSFTVSLTGYDDGEGLPDVSYTLDAYYLSGGKWRKAATSTAGSSASITFAPRFDHTWMIVASADLGSDGNNLEIALHCESGADAKGHSACALTQQPGDTCDTKHKCDTGLSCEGTCVNKSR